MRIAIRSATMVAVFALFASTPAHCQSPTELRELASNFGLTPQEARQVFALYDAQSSRIAALADSSKIDRRLLRAAALRLGATNPNIGTDEFLHLVEGKASQAKQAEEKVAHLESLVAALQQGDVKSQAQTILIEARKAFDEGRLDDSEKVLSGLEVLRQSDLADARDAWKESVFTQMEVLAFAGDNEKASQLAQKAAREEMDQARHDSWAFAMADAQQWFERGELFGDSAALERSIRILQTEALTLAPSDSAPLDWARTQNSIGNALLKMGEHASGTQHLEEALSAYRAALQKITRDSRDDWAMVNSNLCGTLFEIGQRKGEVKSLQEAASDCRLSLEATPKGTPDWTATQEDLGQILMLLGELKQDVSLIAEGLRARASAFSGIEQYPSTVSMAMAQSQYADFLVEALRADDAVEQYRLAIKNLPREHYPMEWAKAQNGLGNALEKSIGTGLPEDKPKRLEEAAAAFRLALEGYQREKTPLDWAMVQENLASVLVDLANEYDADSDDDLAAQRVEQMAAAYRSAAEGYGDAGSQADRLRAQVQLGCELVWFGDHEIGTPHLDEAVPILETVIKEVGQAHDGGKSPVADTASVCLNNVHLKDPQQSDGKSSRRLPSR